MKKNPTLNNLEFLIGTWKTKVYNAFFLSSPAETIEGKSSFEWFENQSFIVLKSESVNDGRPAPPTAVAIINLDDSNGQGAMIYYDERGVSRIYNMNFADNVLKFWRDAPGFNQKFEATVSNDGKILEGAWYAMEDGQTWRRDFEIRYEKVN